MKPADEKTLVAAREATDAFRAAMRLRQASKSMPPWDEMKYFDPPKITTVALTSNTNTLIAAQNPNRIGIVFGTVGAPLGGLFVRPGSPQINGTGSGFALPTNNQLLQFTQSEWGILVQSDWYGQCIGANGTVYITEVILRTWSNG